MKYPLYVSAGAFIGRVNGRDHRAFLEVAECFDCDGFEFLMYNSWYENVASIVRDFLALGASYPVLHADKYIGTLLCRGEAGEREQAVELFRRNCEIACRIGAEKMVLHLWNGPDSDRDMTLPFDTWCALFEMAKESGLLLTAENVVCAYGEPAGYMRRLLTLCPETRFTYDTKMANFHRQLPALYSGEQEWVWQNTAHFHINDHRGAYRDFSTVGTRHIGEGDIDFSLFFRNMKKRSICRSMTLECSCMNADGSVSPERMQGSLRKVRELVAKA